jgi:hypothetical protein
MNAAEITDKLGLHSLRQRAWYIQAACATSGDGLYEGLEWVSATVSAHDAGADSPTSCLPTSRSATSYCASLCMHSLSCAPPFSSSSTCVGCEMKHASFPLRARLPTGEAAKLFPRDPLADDRECEHMLRMACTRRSGVADTAVHCRSGMHHRACHATNLERARCHEMASQW